MSSQHPAINALEVDSTGVLWSSSTPTSADSNALLARGLRIARRRPDGDAAEAAEFQAAICRALTLLQVPVMGRGGRTLSTEERVWMARRARGDDNDGGGGGPSFASTDGTTAAAMRTLTARLGVRVPQDPAPDWENLYRVMSKRKGRGGAPAMYAHRTDTGSITRISADGRRAIDEVLPVEPLPSAPAYYQEDVDTNAALDAPDWDYSMGDDSLPAETQGEEPDGIEVRAKAKRYKNSDLPFLSWVDERDEYLDETLRLEGRGDASVFSACGSCGAQDPSFRCENQMCYGTQLFCQSCIVERHQVLPTHWIQQWMGTFFKRVPLIELGLVMQLGHTPGATCNASRMGRKKFTLIDVTGIHNVAVRFCECDSRIKHRQQLMRVCWWPATVRDPSTCATFAVVRLFQNMNSLGKISAFHFLRSLELLTNSDGLTPPFNRRRAFMYIVRQHRMISMMKRAGRGHTDSGIGGTAQGELALKCRACPQPSINIPDGWDRINWSAMPEDLRYKYFLFLAQDCNFRLINRDVSTEARDPIIDDGLGYFCNRVLYKQFIAAHVDEEEISSCSGFQAMFLANAKRVKGLRTTGVGGVTCARHNMWRANGIGDLQRGERKAFWQRMGGLPEAMHLDMKKIAVWFKVPNFHILGHKIPCHSPFSFHWMWGAGVTDGEDVEQNWDFTNGAAGSTKMMGMGSRHAFLEYLFGFHNWMRTVSYRRVFGRRMARDLREGKKHKEAFEAFTALIEAEQPELIEKWKVWVHDWESEQHTEGFDSPFETSAVVHTMKDIRLRLGKEELTRTGAGIEIERHHTSSTFITMGLEIEQSQRILTVDMKALADPSALQELEFVKRKTALLKKINRFRKLQRTYMPEMVRFLTPGQREVWKDKTRGAESIKLFLPSELEKAGREKACEAGLPGIEEELREGDLNETLEELRQALRLRTMTSRFKHRNMTGQRALTRGQGVLRQITIRIHKAKLRYRYSRNALLRLRSHGVWEKRYRTLDEADVRGVNERAVGEEEVAEREKLYELGEIVEGGIAAAGVVAAGEGRHTMSWIWYSTNTATGEADLVEGKWNVPIRKCDSDVRVAALRVEWCKAYARTRRWHEDIVLVDEEMRRTIEFGVWLAHEWDSCATARTRDVTPELAEGLRAYAMEQVDRESRTCTKLSRQWGGLRKRARAYLAGARLQGPLPEIVVDLADEEEALDDEEGDVPGDEITDGVGEKDAEEDEEE
ncbi:hypothetical protein C8R47DRAFT_1071689 [Mycena vitilis]|nr:hypothetical protein C8R47DRAFT_1071689 [Mycena vitilis]